MLTNATLGRSMGRVGASGDSAAMESFFSLMPKNDPHQHRWRSCDELRYATITSIEHTCNRRRSQRALGTLTPVEFQLG